ncbi:MAG: murein biosynthesis integral membrane protein MurJ, partial [Acidobacteriota bacterium]|nr:murein biosynthesis integral membrane protein MurJ [Acidobacteriota bacterium]
WDVAFALAALALVGTVFSRQLIGFLTIFGAQQGHWQLAVYLNRIIFPAIVFIGLAALAASILNSFHMFALPAATPIFFNLAVIACSFAVFYRPILRWAPPEYRSPAIALAVGL